VILKNSCSKLHCQKGFNLNPFSYKIPKPAIDLGLWLAMQLTYGKIPWLSVKLQNKASMADKGSFELGG